MGAAAGECAACSGCAATPNRRERPIPRSGAAERARAGGRRRAAADMRVTCRRQSSKLASKRAESSRKLGRPRTPASESAASFTIGAGDSVHVKIALVAPPLLPIPPARYGGTERIVAVLADELVARGHDVTLF